VTRLALLFACSGAAGLVYQIVWVREFGNVFGNTIHSAALVIAVFMCGLGAGSYLAGRWADRHYRDAPDRLLRAYAVVEAGIAGLALAVSVLLPRLGHLSAAISAYTTDAAGWQAPTAGSLAARYAIAVALMGPITLLMGGTLTLLIRHVVRHDLAAAGWRVGLLYGVNTAGAAAGCLLTDWALIPGGGLWLTQATAAALNLVAAAGALGLAREAAGPIAAAPVAASPAAPPAATAGGAPLGATALAIALTGFAAMGMEIVWFRHLGSLLGSFRAVLSLILSVILAGIWLGSLAGGLLERRVGHPVALFVGAQALFVAAALAALATAERGPGAVAAVLREVAVPALMMGFAYPLANAIVQDTERAVGRRAGLLYLANTAGAVAGSLVTGFVLLPRLGMQHTVTVQAVAVLAGVVPLGAAALARAPARPRTAAALGAWARLPAGDLVARTLWPLRPGEQRLAVREGLTEIVTVTEMPGEGRALQTNGHLMSGTGLASQRYMRAFAHVPLLSHERPERVLVICFGVGNTAHAATLHPGVRRLDVVDTSRDVLAHGHWFAATNGGVLRAPGVSVYVNDGRQHLAMRPPAEYDLITLEPPPIAFAGVASLYSREFYALARSRLRPGGYVTQWLPVYQVTPSAALSMIRAFVEVFPQAVLLSGWMDELILVGTSGGTLAIDPARVQARVAAAPRLADDLARVHLGSLTELVGTFVADARTLAAATEAYPPATDDYPIQEYASAAPHDEPTALRPLFAPGRVASWCPACFADGRPRPGLEGLPHHLTLLAAVYRDPAFHRYGAVTTPGPRVFRVAVEADVIRGALGGSGYLRRVFGP
jgi:spermidine synthase